MTGIELPLEEPELSIYFVHIRFIKIPIVAYSGSVLPSQSAELLPKKSDQLMLSWYARSTCARLRNTNNAIMLVVQYLLELLPIK